LNIILFMNGKRGEMVLNALHVQGYNTYAVPDTDVNDPKFIEDVKTYKPDLFIVAGYSRIFKKDLLMVPKMGTWNCHAGPVPDYRGGSPLNWQIIDGKDVLGVTLLKMDAGIDTGPVLLERQFRLAPHETIADAHKKANTLFCMMVLQALREKPKPKPQPKEGTQRKQRNDDMGEIDLSWDGERIVNFVRALTHPYPGAWIEKDGKRIRIWSASTD